MKNIIAAAALAAVIITGFTSAAIAGENKEVKAAIAACQKDHKGDKAATKACIKDAKAVKPAEGK